MGNTVNNIEQQAENLSLTLSIKVSEPELINQLTDAGYLVVAAEDDANIIKYLQQRETAIVIPTDPNQHHHETVAHWLGTKGFLVYQRNALPKVEIRLTDSIQDDELEEAITEAFQVHGPKLASLKRFL